MPPFCKYAKEIVGMLGAVFSKLLQCLERDETFMNKTIYNKCWIYIYKYIWIFKYKTIYNKYIINNQNTKCVILKISAVGTRGRGNNSASRVGTSRIDRFPSVGRKEKARLDGSESGWRGSSERYMRNVSWSQAVTQHQTKEFWLDPEGSGRLWKD